MNASTDTQDIEQTLDTERFYYGAGYSAGWDACRLQWAVEWRQKVADLQEENEPRILAAVAERVNEMLDGIEGGHGAHARSVEQFRRAQVPHAPSSPRCECGDWSRGYFYRDAMARHGGVIEAEQGEQA